MKRVFEVDGAELRAHKEVLLNAPLNAAEYKILRERIPYVPLAGEAFDELNCIYPLKIPEVPRAFTINEKEGAYSLLLRQDRISVSLVGDKELKELYNANAGHYIYGVGRKVEKQKNGKTYQNIKLRGWLLVKVKLKQGTTKK